MKSGIYKISNTINGKVYIGVSKDVSKRKRRHFYELKANRHVNTRLQSDYNIFGKDSFKVETLEFAKVEDLYEKEKHYIKHYDSFENGYNMTHGGDGSYGHTVSEQMKRYLSEINRGKNNPNWGKKLSPEHKEKLIAGSIGRPNKYKGKKRPSWIGEKISKANKGRKLSIEHRKLLSEIRKGKPLLRRRNVLFTDEQRERISESHKGIKLSNEAKKQLSVANRGENTNFSKLKEYDVIEIRLRFLKGEKRSNLTKDFSVTNSCIGDILNGKTWKHLPNNIDSLIEFKNNYSEFKSAETSKRKNLTKTEVISIRLDFLNGMSQVEISKKYNVNTKNVCRIVHNQTWKHIPNTIEELDKLIGA